MKSALKRCSICGEHKPESEFSPSGRGYLDSRCRPCNSRRVCDRHAQNPAPKRLRDRQRYWSDPDAAIASTVTRIADKGEAHNARRRELYEKNKRAILARVSLWNAVRSGRLIKPDSCERCGGHGRRIEGHHHDYSKRLEVEWLCSECHGLTRRKS